MAASRAYVHVAPAPHTPIHSPDPAPHARRSPGLACECDETRSTSSNRGRIVRWWRRAGVNRTFFRSQTDP
eukprot:6542044-Prymnesium_polylepis.1